MDRRDNLLELQQTCMWLAIRGYQSVNTEVAVMWRFSKVSTISEILGTIGSSLLDTMIAPFPYTSTHELRIAVE
ncbi:hypothetical protein D1872_273090 [compost metagenome]